MSYLERSDKTLAGARDALIKFDFFLAGLLATYCAYFIKSFDSDVIGWNFSTLELLALLFSIFSLISSFLKIGNTINAIKINGDILKCDEDIAYLSSATNSDVVTGARGEILTPKNVEVRLQEIKRQRDESTKMMDQYFKKTEFWENGRNRALLLSFLLLLASKIWSAY